LAGCCRCRSQLVVALEVSYAGRHDVTIVKYTANGALDRSFGRRGVSTIASGTATSTQTDTLVQRQFDHPAFADLQARADGSIRVITSRRRGTSIEPLYDDGQGPNVVAAKYYVHSQVFGPSGQLVAAEDYNWRVAIITAADVVEQASGDFVHQLVRADGDNGAIFIGTRATAMDHAGYVFRTQATTLSATTRADAPVPIPRERFFETILPYARGYYIVYNNYDEVRASKLRSDFRLTPSYNGGAETVTPVMGDSDATIITDLDGNLLALFGNQISRISGS